MIITKLIGGLGNQMFQYAAGRRAAHTNQTELKLDTSWFKNPNGAIQRDYLLNVFNIEEAFASEEKLNKFRGARQNVLIKLIASYYKRPYVKQRFSYFDKNILKVNDNTYLDGYWTSEKYFKDIEEIVRKEFTFKDKPDAVNQKMINSIKNCDSISIHIRRGDYIFDETTNKYHGVCGLDYYSNSVAMIVKKVKNPYFFIFSDDIKWVKQNLHLKFPCVYVDYNIGKKDYEDMRLMSNCHHNIIANSSFSWWGAWLNQYKNKIIIAPKKCFRDKSIDTTDLIPQPWIKI